MSEEYFQKIYDADEENKAAQDWDTYYDWVQNSVPRSQWTNLVARTSEKLKDGHREGVNQELEALGNRAIGEWAKANNLRALDAGPLKDWGRAIDAAAAEDPGDGSVISAKLNEIEKKLGKLISGRGLPVL